MDFLRSRHVVISHKIEALSVLERCSQKYPLFLFTPEDKLLGQESFFFGHKYFLCIVTTTEEADKSAQSEYSYSVPSLQINKQLW
jgi:hypothetical protein